MGVQIRMDWFFKLSIFVKLYILIIPLTISATPNRKCIVVLP